MHDTTHSTECPSRENRAVGFTILELMVSIAIIFILITTTLVALRTAKKGADRVITRNALKQMMMAYTNYATENNGQLLPGYINPAMFGPASNQFNIKVRTRSGYQLQPGDAASYVWRLAPYLDNDWKTFMADYSSAELESRFDEELGGGDGIGADVFGPATAGPNQLGIAQYPSFGLNSIFLGGDSFHGGPWVLARHPWTKLPNAVYPPERLPTITKLSEGRNASKIIVFAPSRATNVPADPGTSVVLGYSELRAPFSLYSSSTLSGQQKHWMFTGSDSNGSTIAMEPGAATPAGLPIDRFGEDKLSIAHLDGSVETEQLGRLGPSVTSPNHCLFTRWIPDAMDGQ